MQRELKIMSPCAIPALTLCHPRANRLKLAYPGPEILTSLRGWAQGLGNFGTWMEHATTLLP